MRVHPPIQPSVEIRHDQRPDWQRRLQQIGTGPVKWTHFAAVLFVVAGSFYLGYLAGFYGSIESRPVVATLYLIGTVFIFKYPYLGIVLTVASLPITELIPELPLVNTAFTAIGGVTLLGYLLKKLLDRTEDRKYSLHISLVFGALFCIWILASNPSAATLNEDRVWIFTFVQLLAIAWLASHLLNKPHEHRVLIIVLSITLALSVIDTIGEANSGYIANEYRPDGLVGSSNDATRQFVVGFVLLMYLYEVVKNRYFNLLVLAGVGLMITGVVYTLSRTGFALLILAIGLLVIKWMVNRHVSDKRLKQSAFVLVLIILPVWFIPTQLFSILEERILPSVRPGQEVFELRGVLWQIGLDVWFDYPLTGVGIGQYNEVAPEYAATRLRFNLEELNAHNLFIQLLAETGFVGFMLYGGMLVFALRALLRAIHSPDPAIASLSWTWFIVMIVLLGGAMTKQDSYDKMLWLALGISAGLEMSAKQVANRLPVQQQLARAAGD